MNGHRIGGEENWSDETGVTGKGVERLLGSYVDGTPETCTTRMIDLPRNVRPGEEPETDTETRMEESLRGEPRFIPGIMRWFYKKRKKHPQEQPLLQ